MSAPSQPKPIDAGAAPAAASTSADPKGADGAVPQLGALEEDDEFEEFAEQDWSPSETSLAHLASSKPSGAGADASADTQPTATTAHLWEDNWDDDDVEQEFSKQLRAELEKKNGATAMST